MSRPIKKHRALFGAAVGTGATLAVVALGIFVGAGSARTAVAPGNTAPPRLGKTLVGQTLRPTTAPGPARRCARTPTSGGSVTGTPPGCPDITGAAGNEYTLSPPTRGNTLRVQVTAKNADGANTSTSRSQPP